MTADVPRAILDVARWAPSGDNSQPWRFRIVSDDEIVVHGFDTRDHCVYDLDGHPSQLSLGALLETIALAATRFGREALIEPAREPSPDQILFRVRLLPSTRQIPDPLAKHIEARCVQRQALSMRRLSAEEKKSLASCLPQKFSVRWFEGWRDRVRIASLCYVNAKIRLTIPEAYLVHRAVIAWNACFSEDRIPDQALGAARPTLKLMRWAMSSWQRIERLNRWAAGTVAPRLEMDFLPAVACGAHFVLEAQHPPHTVEDYLQAGRAVQRFWLEATGLGLQLQPEYTPLVFARYVREGRPFTSRPHGTRLAGKVAKALERLLSTPGAERAVFLGRIGAGRRAESRSLRLPLERLLMASDAAPQGLHDRYLR